MRRIVKITTFVALIGLALSPAITFAAGGGSTSRSSYSSGSRDFTAGKKAVKAGDYESAARYLTKAAKKDPKNADIQNLLGFSYRKMGNTEKAFEHYNAALRLNPKHRGANEYLGELYLETDQLARAEERLKVLDKACSWGCEEYDELKEAIKNYKAKKRDRASAGAS